METSVHHPSCSFYYGLPETHISKLKVDAWNLEDDPASFLNGLCSGANG